MEKLESSLLKRRRSPMCKAISGRKKAGSASANAHALVGARTKTGCRESWKQKRKCVDGSRVGEQRFIDVDGRGPLVKAATVALGPKRQLGGRSRRAEERANRRKVPAPACRPVEC
ncbi:predicted protein [Histoplasma capsulatum var. duboisii H88]|uniref:Predicted protein n=2 Tax=Ajellomyces capsulatus TaxID=5037 RepID=F0UER9_AJEC8|nr:predicted protein [Histoplasma capsulatum H143]EGC44799.1 predicted protein [Histoplasma capsulatum var. duboisii H88]